jgi:hypothetical protein
VNYLLIRHKVADFESWKSGYDAHLVARQQAGLTEKHLLRNIEDRNEVLLLFEVANLDAAKRFADLRFACSDAKRGSDRPTQFLFTQLASRLMV